MKQFNFPESVPLHYDDYDSIRVIGSRITLHTLVGCLKMGDTAEDILDNFPSLTLSQINAVIEWYLNHRAEADEYIREVDIEAEKIRQEIESRPESIVFREKLRSLLEQRIKA